MLESTDTVEVAQLTGPGSVNDTDRRWNLYAADLGHMFWHQGRLAMVFGDNFGPDGQDWRSNALAWVDARDLPRRAGDHDGLAFTEVVTGGRTGSERGLAQRLLASVGTGTGSGGQAAELLGSQKVAGQEVTVIPTAGVSVEGRMILHYMSVRRWLEPGEWEVGHAGLAYSDDEGQSWTKHPTARWPGDSNFAQVAIAGHHAVSSPGEPPSDHPAWLYLFGIPAGRFGPAHLARVRPADILEVTDYTYWTGDDWTPDPSGATTVVPAPVGELSVGWSDYHHRWLMMYLDENRQAIVARSASRLTGPWSAPAAVASAADYPQLYAPYLVPEHVDGPEVYFTMSRYRPYQVFLMRTTLRLAGEDRTG